MSEQEHLDNLIASGYEDDAETRQLAAVSYAADVLLAAGFHSPEMSGRDMDDPLYLTSAAGIVISIGPVPEEEQ